MASSYSDNLKLQLMATGENAGTWGSVTNVNLGTALEEALGGTVDVTFASGTVTLSAADDNTTQQYRHMRLNLTGTSGGAQDLVVPAVEKVYIVNNGCADAITIKVTGQTGVAVPAGKTMFVYNNGTDCVDAVTHLSSLTLGSPLAVAQGGTGSTTATFSGANITSLNASNISAGTLANARTTASSANGASTIVSRDASGDFAGSTITATTGFSGPGGSLTGLNASNVSAGTLATARLDASSANGASTVVQRDASGDFAGNAITGVSFSGSGASLTSLNASNVSAGTLANARTTAASANGASTIVARDATGNFAGNAITGVTFSGSGASLTSLNASNVSAGTLANARTTAASANGASTIVARDASGNFSAGTITAALSGNASTASAWATGRTISLTGDVTGTSGSFDGSGNLSFSTSLATDSVAANEIASNAVGADELNVTGNGTTSQFLRSDGDGSFTWAVPTDTDTTYSAGSGLDLTGTTFSVEPDLRDGITHIGLDSGDYIGWTNNSHTSFFVNGGEEARLEADGDFHADGDVIAYSTTISDERLKTNIVGIENAVAKVSQLNGYTFEYKADGKVSAGVIAQEVEKVLPEAVTEKLLPLKTDDGQEYKVVNYDALHGLLIEAVKELSARVEALEGK